MFNIIKILFFLSIVFLQNDCKGQAGLYWYFTYKNALKFDNYPPTIVNNSALVFPNNNGGDGSGTITDNNGNLLFYNNGDSVWNRNNVAMPNGFNLCSSSSSGYSSLSIPFINDTNRYYIFQSAGYFATNVFPNFYNINVVNMSLNGGLGDVEVKNDTLYMSSSDRLTATKAANGLDYWLITHPQIGNGWKVFKINCLGIDRLNPILSNAGTALNTTDYVTDYPTLKISANGKLLATNFTDRGYIELYQFNNSTGQISNPIKIIGEQIRTRTFEFSPDSKQLYLFSDNPFPSLVSALNQYDVSVYDSTIISDSRVTVAQGFNLFYTSGQMQTAIDNRIYIATSYNFLHIIQNPNIHGLGCNFLYNGLALQNFSIALPYTVPSVTTNPNVQISYTVAADCRTVTFNAKTYIKGNNLTFKWKWGEPPPVAGTAADSATQVIASGGDTTYTTITHTYPPGIDTFFVALTVTSDTLCGTGRAGARVVVKPPKPTANFGFVSTCNSLNVVFTDSSQLNFNPSLSYQYAFKPALAPPIAYSNFSTAPNNNYTFAAYDSFDVRLIVRSPLGCVQADTIVKRVVLKAKPTAGFTYTNNCGSLQATFTNTATIAAGSIAVYEYYLGNTLIGSSSSNVVYTFPAYGSYTVKQVVKSNVGCVSDTVGLPVVIIKAKPTLSLAVLQDSVCTNTTFTVTAAASVAASSISNYTWLRNGVVLPTTANQITDNQPTGTYVYKAIANAATGCKSDTANQSITVVSKPTSTLTATNNCGSRQININSTTNVINDIITTHYLDYGDGNTSSVNPNNTTYTYSNYGSYTIKYVPKSSVGCAADTVFFPVVVKDKPSLSIAYNNDACQNTNYVLTATASVNSSSIASYTWVRNGVVLPTTSSILTENNIAGNYTYQVVAVSALGCKSDTVSQNVVVEKYPTTAFTAAGGCVGRNIVITNSSINNPTTTGGAGSSLTYAWTTSDGQISTALVPNFSFLSSGTKTITLTASTQNGCATTASQNFTVEDYPIAAFDIIEACLGKPIAITNNSTGAISSYNWQVVGSAQTSTATVPNFTFNNEGNYSIKLEVATPNNCTNAISKSTTIRAVRLFTTPAADTNVIINQPIQLGISGAATYTWTPSFNLNTATGNSPIFTSQVAGVYPLQIQGTTAQGCKGNASLVVKVFAGGTYVWIPGAFTPNGDGLNDRLRILCSGLKTLNGFTLYNRYGQKVYEQTSCNSNGWNGFFNGILQPTGNFVYTWQGVAFDGKIVSGKGSVILIR